MYTSSVWDVVCFFQRCGQGGPTSTCQKMRGGGTTVKYMYTLAFIIHEMLRKERQGNTTQQKDKATQHNSPKTVIFQRKKLPWVGLKPTTKASLLPTKLPRQLSWLGSSHIYNTKHVYTCSILLVKLPHSITAINHTPTIMGGATLYIYIHIHTDKSLPSVPPSPEEHNLPTTSTTIFFH